MAVYAIVFHKCSNSIPSMDGEGKQDHCWKVSRVIDCQLLVGYV